MTKVYRTLAEDVPVFGGFRPLLRDKRSNQADSVSPDIASTLFNESDAGDLLGLGHKPC
jgi:hypothetical protein